MAESRIRWLRDLVLDCILASDELAEIKAARECLRRGLHQVLNEL